MKGNSGVIAFIVAIASPLLLQTTPVSAQSFSIFGGHFSTNSFLRMEASVKTTSKQNPWNQLGWDYNEVPLRQTPGNPFTGYETQLVPTGDLVPINAVVEGISDRGGILNEDAYMNYHVLRFESTPQITWDNFRFVTRIRALYDPGGLGYADFNPADYPGPRLGGPSNLYNGDPNYFAYSVEGRRQPLWFEFSGRNYMVDFPAFFLEYTNGPFTARLGNQTIAWGQALFFRVFDVANGLDLRRKLIIDRAIEEYADKRMSAPGLRLTHQFTSSIQLDVFGQQFIPSVVPNPNTPYNVIPTPFTVRDRYVEGDFHKEFNYGFRLRGEFGQFSLQAMATRRYNPFGTYRWTETGINRDLPNSNALGLAFNQYCALVLGNAPDGCGPNLAQTAFESSPTGIHTAEEWFDYAARVRLDGLEALNDAIRDFPAAQEIFAQEVDNTNAASNQLDAFLFTGEGLRGHIERVYVPENIFGLGGSWLTQTEDPNSIWDSIILNIEVSYTPDRAFAFSGLTGLKQEIETRSEWKAALVAEKYHRFSPRFPATYLVAQYLFQSESDLFERHLSGYGGRGPSVPRPRTGDGGDSFQPKLPDGISNAHYLAFAFLQPWPAYIWELSAATLIDVQGSILIQPGVQWKPTGSLTVGMFYNYINGTVWTNNPNKTLLSTADFADELSLRIGYQF